MYYTPGQDCLGDVVHHYSHLMVSYDGFHYMVSQSLYGFHYMVSQSLHGFHYMVSQSLYGFHYMVSQSLYGFHYMVSQSLYGFHYMVSQSSYGSIIWFLNQKMVSYDGFQKWFLNQKMVNYMFPNQASAFSRYSATDSSKCASTTDSSCFRARCKVKRGERWYHLFGLTQNGYLSNHKVVCRCDFR